MSPKSSAENPLLKGMRGPGGPDDAHLTRRAQAKRFGVSPRSLGRWAKERGLPEEHWVGGQRCRWLSEIIAWEQGQLRAGPRRRHDPSANLVQNTAKSGEVGR